MNKFEKILLTVFLIEVFVGGGGRLIDFGVISIRQLLFMLVVATYVYRLFREKAFFNKDVNTFIRLNPASVGMYLLIGWFVVSTIIGILNGNSFALAVKDLFRVSYFMVYFPLAYYISAVRFTKADVINLLKYSALAVAIFTIAIDLLGKTIFGGPDFKPFYDFMNNMMNDDLFFRPSNSVFYKSHLYVLIGLVISLNALFEKKYTKVDIANIILCSISVLWSETRGFLLAFMVSALVIILLDLKVLTDPIKGMLNKLTNAVRSKHFLKKSIVFLVIIVSIPFLYKYMTLERFEEVVVEEENQAEPSSETNSIEGEARTEKVETKVNDVSVNSRLTFIKESRDILMDNPVDFIIGTGHGTEIAGRIMIEMSFLEILVEQGVIGLSIWVFLSLLVFLNYYSLYKKGYKPGAIEISLMAAFMGLLLLTNINPFINNSIGIIFFVLVLVLSQNQKDKVLLGDRV
jgi:hypothetical protein